MSNPLSSRNVAAGVGAREMQHYSVIRQRRLLS